MNRRDFLAGVSAIAACTAASRAASSVDDAESLAAPVLPHPDLYRNAARLPTRWINRFLSICPVTKSHGRYLKICPSVCARILDANLMEYCFDWPVKHSRPTDEFRYESYRTVSRDFRGKEQFLDAMQYRKQKIFEAIRESSWPTEHVWTHKGICLDTIRDAVHQIMKWTRAVITHKDMLFVANPLTWNNASYKPKDDVSVSCSCIPEGDLIVLSRPGGIEAVAGCGPSFATITAFFRNEMKMLPDGAIREEFCVEMTCPAAGIYLKGT